MARSTRSTASWAWSPSRTCQGSDLGPLQRASWRRQFAALRDGDRFFYLNDPALERIADRYGVTYKHSLAEIVEAEHGRGCARTTSSTWPTDPVDLHRAVTQSA